MALLTLQDCKDYLRIQGTAEDVMLEKWRLMSVAKLRAFFRRPIVAEQRTFRIDRPSTALYRTDHQIILPIYPVAVADSDGGTADLAIVDADATTLIEDTDYSLDVRTGVLTALSDGVPYGRFTKYPYTVTAWVGLSALPEYADFVEPLVNEIILDFVADRYQVRSPGATSETTGGGVSSSYAGGNPKRAMETLEVYRMARAL